VHQIDGMNKGNEANYKTNDMNLLPKSAIDAAALDPALAKRGGEYLGGV